MSAGGDPATPSQREPGKLKQKEHIMFTISVIIPKADNNGRDFTADEIDAFEAELVAIFGGYTRETAPVVGGWAYEGRVYRDTSFRYILAVSSLTEGGKVAEAVTVAKARFAQEAIFIQYLGLSEVL